MAQALSNDRSSNAHSANTTKVSQEMEDRIMSVLPKPIADWLRYEACSDFCVKEIFKEWRAGMPVDTMLNSLRSITRKQTAKTYGRRHPQAAMY